MAASISETSRQVGIAKSAISKWITRYKSNGIEGLMDLPRSGQPKRLPQEKEKDFIDRINNGPLVNDGVSTFDAKFIQKILIDEFAVKYSINGVYDLLKRLGIKKKASSTT